MSMTISQLVLIPWYAFGAYWAISFLGVKPTKTSERAVDRLKTIVPIILAFELLFSNWLRIGPLRVHFVPVDTWVAGLGLVITCMGAALACWARYCIGQYWSARVTLKEDHQLIRSGPYAYVRHPIYAGTLLAATGSALVIGEWRCVLAVLVMFAALVHKAAREEALLTTEFGARFTDYRSRTGRLVPRLSRATQ